MSLIVRTHTAKGIHSLAIYSSCERFRYSLTRSWDAAKPRLLYIMLNPSKATELANDPTIERCQRRATHLGYGAFRVCNLFALRESDPARLRRARAPVGPDNATQLSEAIAWCDDILCAWGVHGTHRDQNSGVIEQLRGCGKRLLVLGLTKNGHPRHPLYVPYHAELVEWSDVSAGRWPDSTQQTLDAASPRTPPA